MFSFLFGTKKQEAKASVQPIGLQQRIDELEKKIGQLERLKDAHHQNAIQQKAKGNTNSAVHFLKKEKLVDEELVSANNMLLMLVQQKSALDMATMNVGTLHVLDNANRVIKEQQSSWTPDKVADLVDDIDDVKNIGREINDLICGAANANHFDISDEDLLALDMACVPVPLMPMAASHMPTLPTVPTATLLMPTAAQIQQQKTTMSSELQALEA
jgi:hypothetical protein